MDAGKPTSRPLANKMAPIVAYCSRVCIWAGCKLQNLCYIIEERNSALGLPIFSEKVGRKTESMTVSARRAAKTLIELCDAQVSNLELQKILYLANMVHLGRYGEPLVSGSFEAWDYGPVHPTIYHDVKYFGSKPIKNAFYGLEPIEEGRELETLMEACRHLKNKSSGELVANTHMKGGAWDKNYSPSRRGIKIPNEDIIAEYNERTEHRQ